MKLTARFTSSTLTTALAAALLATPNLGQTWVDDFDLPDGTSMGPDWTEVAGDMAIANLMGKGDQPKTSHKMSHNSAQGDYSEARASITLGQATPGELTYTALIIGDGGSHNLFTKLQGNNSNGDYDTLWFYSKDSSNLWGSGSKKLATPVKSARMEVYVTNGGDTLNVDIDSNFDGVVDEHFENSGILSFAGQLGTGFAVGAYGESTYDDWRAEVGPTGGLEVAPDELSLSLGGTQSMQLSSLPEHAGLPYLVMGSLSGTSPGLPLDPGLVLPLNPDIYWLHTLQTPFAGPLQGAFGLLDGQARAQASFVLPPGSPAALAGIELNHAFIVLELLPTLLHVVYVSEAEPLTLQP